jgi:hypothetical protein
MVLQPTLGLRKQKVGCFAFAFPQLCETHSSSEVLVSTVFAGGFRAFPMSSDWRLISQSVLT